MSVDLQNAYMLSVCPPGKGEGFHPHHEGQRMQQLSREMRKQAAGWNLTWFFDKQACKLKFRLRELIFFFLLRLDQPHGPQSR